MLHIKGLTTFVLAFGIFVAMNQETEAAYYYSPPPESEQLLEYPATYQIDQYTTIANSFIDSSKVVSCLSTKYYFSCDSVNQIYHIMDLEIDRIGNDIRNDFTSDDSINIFGTFVQRMVASFEEVGLKCRGSSKSMQECLNENKNNYLMVTAKIPEDLREFIDTCMDEGKTLMRILQMQPSIKVLSSMRDIVKKAVIAIGHDNTIRTTSIKKVVTQFNIVVEQMHKLLHYMEEKHGY